MQPTFRPSVALAYERRPEVKQARVGTELARRGVTLARATGGPTLGLGFNYNYNLDTSAFNSRSGQWNAVAAVSLPVFEGGLTRARVTQARADVGAAQVAEEQAREGVALEVQQAILSIREASERLSAAGTNVRQAQEALRLAKVRYREGVATPLEVTDAQAVLTQAESNEVNARYDYLLATARYERAVGPAAGTE